MKSIKNLDLEQLFGESIHIKESKNIVNIGLHRHNYYEMIYYYKGEAISCINGTELYLQSGSLYLLTPTDLHHTYEKNQNNDVHFINISFTEDMIDREIVTRLQQPIHIHNLSEKFKFFPLIELLRCAKNIKEKQHLLNVLLYRLVAEGTEITPTPGLVLPDNIRQSIRYITIHFQEPITLELVANSLHLNTSYFSSLFSKIYGCSFKTYLINFRLGHAKQLLLNTDWSVSEICTSSGFQNFSNFMRTFKKREGITPTEFRKMHKKTLKTT